MANSIASNMVKVMTVFFILLSSFHAGCKVTVTILIWLDARTLKRFTKRAENNGWRWVGLKAVR
jgi:hypothetical protein